MFQQQESANMWIEAANISNICGIYCDLRYLNGEQCDSKQLDFITGCKGFVMVTDGTVTGA